MKTLALVPFFLASLVFASLPHPHLAARQNAAPCIPDSLLGRIGASNGGRKIGLVIDASLSMEDNDPDDVRLDAAAAINNALISGSEAIDGKTADLVTVVEFSSSASLIYPLGDPANAGPVIAGITLLSGTFISSGIQAGTDELTKAGADPTAGRTGLIVFTDGQDNTPELTVDEINRAAGLGIRVSFGFLSVDSSTQQRDILDAILRSGGIYATIDSAAAQQTFVGLVLAQGLTALDNQGASGNASSTLLPGLATAAFLSTSANTFTYAAQAGEVINVTATAIDPIELQVTLRDAATGTDIATNTTSAVTSSSSDPATAFLEYTASADIELQVIVTSPNTTATGIFSLGLRSSLALAAANCSAPTPVGSNNTNTSISYTPTASSPAQFTGGAMAAFGGSQGAVSAALVFSVLGMAAAAL